MEFYKPVKWLLIAFLILLATQQIIYYTDATATEQKIDQTNFIGIWERQGYGDIVVISKQKTGAEHYEFTRATCLQVKPLSKKALKTVLQDAVMATDKQTFSTMVESPFQRRYTKRTALPASCQPNRLLTKSIPIAVFEHFWHTFNDYYAFFNEHGVDWQQQYKIYRPQVTTEITNDELFDLLTQMVTPIRDGHITLYSDDDDFSPEKETPLFKALNNSFEQQDRIDDSDDYQYVVFDRIGQNVQRYLVNSQQAGGKEGNVVQWGKLKAQPSVAYVAVSRMFALANDTDEDNTSSTTADKQAVEQIFARVLQDLADTQAMIIDMRLNGGGYDSVSIKIANYFTDKKQMVLQKYARGHASQSSPVSASITPATHTYTHKPIIILSSNDTMSAAEIFLLAMHRLPNVRIMGERSNGALSDELKKTLPNGWGLALSNEVYLDYQQKNYEVVGVPVAIPMQAFSLAAIQQGRDPLLEKAMTSLVKIHE